MSNLAQRIPAKYRTALYLAYAVLGVALGSIPVYCATTEVGVPSWVLGALAVYGYVGGAFGLTASANTPSGNGRGLFLEGDE